MTENNLDWYCMGNKGKKNEEKQTELFIFFKNVENIHLQTESR